MNEVRWPLRALRRLSICHDHLRIPLNAEERAARPGDIPYWGANTIQGYVDTALVHEPVVLIGEDGAPFFDRDRPVAFYITNPVWPNNHIHVLRPRTGIEGRWLAYALNNVDYSLYIAGSTRDKLTQASLMSIVVPTPLAADQCAIADYLDRETAAIDALTMKQDQLIQRLRERRAAVVEHATAFLDWSIPLRSIATMIQTGPFGSQLKSEEYQPDGVPVINPSHIVAGRVCPDRNVAVSHAKADELCRHLFREGDMVVARRGELGRCAVIGSDSAGFVCGTGSALVRPDKSRVSPHFLALVYGGRKTRDSLALASVGSTMDNLNAGIIGSLRVPVPALHEQVRILDLLHEQTAKIDLLIDKARCFIELAKERRAALIAAAVTGRIDALGAA